MKLRLSNQRNRAWTMIDIAVVIAVMVVLGALLLPILAAAKKRASRVSCVSNLKQVNLAFRIWAGDNNNKYPMEVSVTNGGAMESIATGDVVTCFRVMSNDLSTPKILLCPVEFDSRRTPATNFENGFGSSHISYFVGVDADERYPERLLSGDDNFQVNGATVPSGLFQFATNAPIAWSPDRHFDVRRIPYLGIPIRREFVGNLGFADGSVGMGSTPDLQKALVETGLATNRLAIP